MGKQKLQNRSRNRPDESGQIHTDGGYGKETTAEAARITRRNGRTQSAQRTVPMDRDFASLSSEETRNGRNYAKKKRLRVKQGVVILMY